MDVNVDTCSWKSWLDWKGNSTWKVWNRSREQLLLQTSTMESKRPVFYFHCLHLLFPKYSNPSLIRPLVIRPIQLKDLTFYDKSYIFFFNLIHFNTGRWNTLWHDNNKCILKEKKVFYFCLELGAIGCSGRHWVNPFPSGYILNV